MKTIGSDWLDYAKRLPVGRQFRAQHNCAKSHGKTAFIIGNSTDAYWCKCYRCNFTDHVSKTHVTYRAPVPRPIRPPSDLKPIIELIAERPQALLPVLTQHRLLGHLSLLKVSERSGRLYLPDWSDSFCGLDYTGTAGGWWYSPYGHYLAVQYASPSSWLLITSDATEYLDESLCSAIFMPVCNKETLLVVQGFCLRNGMKNIGVSKFPPKTFETIQKELSVCGASIFVT